MCIASAPELRVNQLIHNAIITKFPGKEILKGDFYNVTDKDLLEALDHYMTVISDERWKTDWDKNRTCS